MKLSTPLIQQTLQQLEDQATFEEVEVVPENNPAMPKLRNVFGDHTFFLDSEGLHIVEPAENPQPGALTGQLVGIAEWRDEERTMLAPHAPEPTDIIVILESDDSDMAS